MRDRAIPFPASFARAGLKFVKRPLRAQLKLRAHKAVRSRKLHWGVYLLRPPINGFAQAYWEMAVRIKKLL
jgi:hypothetical protein